jgi:hypothetical protein
MSIVSSAWLYVFLGCLWKRTKLLKILTVLVQDANVAEIIPALSDYELLM